MGRQPTAHDNRLAPPVASLPPEKPPRPYCSWSGKWVFEDDRALEVLARRVANLETVSAMGRKRDLVGEIIEKKQRLLAGAPRMVQFNKRVGPLVRGFREIRALDAGTDYRDEWLKYGAIGYVACIEGYLRLLITDLIDHGDPYLGNVAGFKDLRLTLEPITAVQAGRITFGEFVAHLLPLSSIEDINSALSTLLGVDFLKHFNDAKVGGSGRASLVEAFPDAIGRVQNLFRLRHEYAHELAPADPIDPAKVENCISGAAVFVLHTEELIRRDFLKDDPYLKG